MKLFICITYFDDINQAWVRTLIRKEHIKTVEQSITNPTQCWIRVYQDCSIGNCHVKESFSYFEKELNNAPEPEIKNRFENIET